MNSPDFEQLTAAQKANTEVLMALVRTTFNGMERLTELNMSASRDLFNTSVSSTQQLLSAKDAKDAGQISTALTQPGMNKWMDYSRSLYDLVADVQKEVTAVIEAQYSDFSKKANTAVEKVQASSPVGGDVFAATMQSLISASNQAFGNMTSMAKQLTDIAESNVRVAGSATAKAAAATTKKAK